VTDVKQVIGDTVALIKEAQEIAKGLEQADLATKLMDAREHLGTLREALLEERDKSTAQEQRIRDLERSLELQPRLLRHMGVYWAQDDPDPWCPTCWERDHRAIHLSRTDLMAGRLCSCTVCQYSVNLDNTRPPKTWPEPASD
jgi:hypothetical protein